jgi:hypothetical protein
MPVARLTRTIAAGNRNECRALPILRIPRQPPLEEQQARLYPVPARDRRDVHPRPRRLRHGRLLLQSAPQGDLPRREIHRPTTLAIDVRKA